MTRGGSCDTCLQCGCQNHGTVIAGNYEDPKELPPQEPSAYGQLGEDDSRPCLQDYFTEKVGEYDGIRFGVDRERKKVGPGVVRVFQTGATRDTDANKLDYHGFLAPIVLERYAQYMHKHRVQSDGSLRDSDNWQKGMPKLQYLKSLIRHVVEFWRDPAQETACSILFNVMGWLYEDLRTE